MAAANCLGQVPGEKTGKTTQELIVSNSTTVADRKDNFTDSVLDDMIVATTQKRKKYPQHIKKNLIKEHNFNFDQLIQCTTTPDTVSSLSADSLSTKPCLLLQSDLPSRSAPVMSKLATLTKSVSQMVDKAGRLEKAYRMFSCTEQSRTQKVISHPRMDEHQISTSLTPLRRRIDHPYRTPPTKVLQCPHQHQRSSSHDNNKPCNYKEVTSICRRRSARLKGNQ